MVNQPLSPGERKIEAICIGASAGAVEALSIILPALPANFPLSVLVVVHLPPDKRYSLAKVFQTKCAIAVKEAEDKEPIASGTVYLAPPDYHMLVEQDRRISLSSEDPVHYSRPSIDVLFESAADAFGATLLGIVLTGANADGARGLRAVADGGGVTIVQLPSEAQARAMPQAALDLCPDAMALRLTEITTFLQEVAQLP